MKDEYRRLIRELYQEAIETVGKSALEELANTTGDERIQSLNAILQQIDFSGDGDALADAVTAASTTDLKGILTEIAVETVTEISEKVGQTIIQKALSAIASVWKKFFG